MADKHLISIDVTDLSIMQQFNLKNAILTCLDKSAWEIAGDLQFYPECEAATEMRKWEKGARDQRLAVLRQFKEVESAKSNEPF